MDGGLLLERLAKVRVVYWIWNRRARGAGLTPGERSVGVIAQELEKIFPELVSTGADGLRRVDYGGLAALALRGLQLLRSESKALACRVDHLESKLRANERPKRSKAAKKPRRGA